MVTLAKQYLEADFVAATRRIRGKNEASAECLMAAQHDHSAVHFLSLEHPCRRCEDVLNLMAEPFHSNVAPAPPGAPRIRGAHWMSISSRPRRMRTLRL